MNLKVNEIFYSIQGEGGRAGSPSIFIRLADCNLNCAFCDTDWKQGVDMTLAQIGDAILPYNAWWIVWTGGEPTLQLTDEVLDFFPEYMHAIETNGTNPVPSKLDYIAVSPKAEVTMDMLWKNFPQRDYRHRNPVDEWRYPYEVGNADPPKWDTLPGADYYFVSPLFTGAAKLTRDDSNIAMAGAFVLKNPMWQLSLQLHKIINMR